VAEQAKRLVARLNAEHARGLKAERVRVLNGEHAPVLNAERVRVLNGEHVGAGAAAAGGTPPVSIKGPHKATHGQGEATSQHSLRGQQTLRHEVTQAWGAKPPVLPLPAKGNAGGGPGAALGGVSPPPVLLLSPQRDTGGGAGAALGRGGSPPVLLRAAQGDTGGGSHPTASQAELSSQQTASPGSTSSQRTASQAQLSSQQTASQAELSSQRLSSQQTASQLAAAGAALVQARQETAVSFL